MLTIYLHNLIFVKVYVIDDDFCNEATETIRKNLCNNWCVSKYEWLKFEAICSLDFMTGRFILSICSCIKVGKLWVYFLLIFYLS